MRKIVTAQFIFVFYRINENDNFPKLDQESPKEVQNFANKISLKILEDIVKRENPPTFIPTVLSREIFLKALGEYPVPCDLLKLFDFAEEYGHYNSSENFYLTTIDDTGLKTWSGEMEFRIAFIEFAGANGTGSIYGFCVLDANLSECPIIIFGDEGGIYIVADNSRELIHLLTFDVEPSVSNRNVYFNKDEDYEHSVNHEECIKWVEDNFGLKTITTEQETEIIIEKAQKKYQKPLHEYLNKFGIETEE